MIIIIIISIMIIIVIIIIMKMVSIMMIISDCLSVYYICSPLSGDQPWQVRYQKKNHNRGKAESMFLRVYDQQMLP